MICWWVEVSAIAARNAGCRCALHGVEGIGPDWQLRVYSQDGRDHLELRVETRPEVAPESVRAEQIRENLLRNMPVSPIRSRIGFAGFAAGPSV